MILAGKKIADRKARLHGGSLLPRGRSQKDDAVYSIFTSSPRARADSNILWKSTTAKMK